MKSFYNEFLKSCQNFVTGVRVKSAYETDYEYRPVALEVPATEPIHKLNTYTSFSGCDIVIGINGEIIGETSSLKYAKLEPFMAAAVASSDYFDRHMVANYPVALELKFTVFDRLIELPDKFNISITFANEYGQKNHMSIFEVSPLWKYSDFSIDNVISELTVVCCAADVTLMNKDLSVKADDNYAAHYENALDISELSCFDFDYEICKKFIGKNNHYANLCMLATEAIDSFQLKDVNIFVNPNEMSIKSMLIKRSGKYYKLE